MANTNFGGDMSWESKVFEKIESKVATIVNNRTCGCGKVAELREYKMKNGNRTGLLCPVCIKNRMDQIA